MMTREEFKRKINTLSCWLSYPTLDALHEIDDHDAEQRAEIAAKQARIQALEARLGLDVCYTCVSIEPYLEEKRALTDQEKLTFPDKVTCLEADVQLRDSKIEQQGEEIARLREALQGILDIGKRDMTNPKYDVYFEQAQQALKESTA